MTIIDWAATLSKAQIDAVKDVLSWGEQWDLSKIIKETDPVKLAQKSQVFVAGLHLDKRAKIRTIFTPVQNSGFATLTGIAV